MGFVVTSGQGPHRRKSTNAHRRDTSLSAAADHHIGVTVLNQPERVADRMGAGCTSNGCGRIRPFCSVANGDIPARQIDDARRNKERRDPAGAPFEQRPVLPFDHFESTDSASDIHTEVLGLSLVLRKFQVCRLYGKLGRGHRKLNEPAHLLHVSFVDVAERIEILYFTRDACRESGGIELGNKSNSILALPDCRPVLFRARADGTNESHARHNDPTLHVVLRTPASLCRPKGQFLPPNYFFFASM